MRINVINKTLIIGRALQQNHSAVSPRFGTVRLVNENVFKFTPVQEGSKGILCPRVDLSELFKGIPQDISHLNVENVLGGDTDGLNEWMGVNLMQAEPLVDGMDYEQVSDADTLGLLFVQWVRLVGVGDLQRGDVDLSRMDDQLIIEARRSPVYKGTVSVKVNEGV